MVQFASMLIDGMWSSIRHALSSIDDGVLAMRARLALLLAIGHEGSRIIVEARDGCVTLSGEVASPAVAARAVSAVQAIDPISVADRLGVTFVQQQRYADADIQRAVQTRLLGARVLRVSGIRVAAVYDGLVLLTGTAVSAAAHLNALEVVAGVPGVRRVTTEVTIEDAGQVGQVGAAVAA
jgi:osmotically-inducible protein OsmY